MNPVLRFQLNRIEAQLRLVFRRQGAIIRKDFDMSAAIDRITASVQTLTSRDDSIVTLLGSISQEVRDANSANDPAINALADSIDAESAKVLAAVNANTPAATAPAADPNAPAA